MTRPPVAVVVLAWGAEPHLGACLRSVLAACGTDDAVVVVDNGADAAVMADLPADRRMTVLRPGRNTGFAGGCRLGVEATDPAATPVVAFVNSDVTVDADALDALIRALTADAQVGLVCGSLRLADAPERLNARGVAVGYVGLAWAADLGAAAADFPDAGDVASVSGGLFGLRRTTWDDLDGFAESYFAYHEDVDLSLRVWLRGQSVRYEPAAVAHHAYEFGRNPRKLYLLERNRWQTVLADYPSAVLRRVLPAALAFDLLLAVVAWRQGWGAQKLEAWRWLITHRAAIRERRQLVQSDRVMSDTAFAALLRPDVAAPVLGDSALLRALNSGLRAYWRIASRGLR